MKILMSWIGRTDLLAAEKNDPAEIGPIAQALRSDSYDRAVFLDNYRDHLVQSYQAWLASLFPLSFEIRSTPLSGPTNHKEIYEAARDAVRELIALYPEAGLTFHISPGTPAMALVWMLLAPVFGARVIESSREQGVQVVESPFEIAAYFLPDRDLQRLTQADAPAHPAFKDILYKSESMRQVVSQAIHVAPRDVTVLIEGESGTGKELFARAIHSGSQRSSARFIPVNCGAIPSELLESQLFGHHKGAFTNALKDAPGFFQAADGGTLFLDELGELPPNAQVKLLRALESRAVTPVGGTEEIPVDVRIIAATNKNLFNEVLSGRFRSDLFYRLAVAILRLPPLRERYEDLDLLLDQALAKANEELSKQGGSIKKVFSERSKKLLLQHPWFGNVRELNNTIIRAALWSPSDLIDEKTISGVLLSSPVEKSNIMDRPLTEGFSLKNLQDEVARHYLKKAMLESNGVKTKAAQLLGFEQYQTLGNWLKKYGLE